MQQQQQRSYIISDTEAPDGFDFSHFRHIMAQVPLHAAPGKPSTSNICCALQAGWSEVQNRHKRQQAAPEAPADAAAADAAQSPPPLPRSPPPPPPPPPAAAAAPLPPFIDLVWSGQLPPGTFGSQPRDALYVQATASLECCAPL